MDKTAPLLPAEREFFSHCKQDRFVQGIVPSIVIGVMVKRALPFIRPSFSMLAGVVAGAGSLGVMSIANDTVCVRDFCRQPQFPMAVALRQQLRVEHPDYSLHKWFDQNHPGHDAAALQAGETKLGRIPDYRMSDVLVREIFAPQTIAPTAQTTQSPAIAPAAASAASRSLPPLPTNGGQTWQEPVEEIEVITSVPVAAASPSRRAVRPAAAVDTPPPSRQRAPASSSYSTSPFDALLSEEAPAPPTRSRTREDPRESTRTNTRPAADSSSSAAKRQPAASSSNDLPVNGMRLRRNRYGDEVWVEDPNHRN